jgi:predicted nucleic acid-binding protein
MVDTNVFNRIADGLFSRAQLPADAELIATHIQVDEINRTSDLERRAILFLTFAQHQPTIVATESAIWGVSRWDHAKWGEGTRQVAIRAALDTKNGGKPNNVSDALIAEAAIANGYGLITADRDLAEIAKQFTSDVVHIAP